MTMANPATYVFISYVRDNGLPVGIILERLRGQGLTVWCDRDDIGAGDRWSAAIRDGIRKSTYFLACFSKAFSAREDTYMYEELRIAAMELEKRRDSKWFIPVRLDDCRLPDMRIGEVSTLSDLQWIDLFPDFNIGMQRLIETLAPLRTVPVRGGNDIVLQPGDMWEKLESAVRHWNKGGRTAAGLLSGLAYFAAQCWVYTEGIYKVDSPKYSPSITGFIHASREFIGGDAGWNEMLRERAVCSTCRTAYKLENIRVCAGCLRYFCYKCGAGGCCDHSQLVG